MSKVLITGTSSGIGLETAIVLGRAGHTVYATMRNPERGSALREAVENERLPISIWKMDVDSDESVDAATTAIRSQAGSIDVLVNNAGIERTGSIEGLAFDDFKATMETNYFGPLRSIRAWLADMRKRQSGCIINVTSVAGRIACSPLGPYSASKYALEAISEALAQEVKPFNVRVAIVQPGIIDTAMARRIEDVPTDTVYPQVRRFGHLFEASLDRPTPPTLVAEKIREIIESGTQKLRHPVGPDAEGFLAWRASLNDEDWVEWGALADDAWYERVARDFGLDARSKQRSVTAAAEV
ncbi:MAG TPA: SDR family oxidoreductase [Vicinamibacterales bacterium]|jgi:NAD(P)-dependent dehydrogenase (short-subunit alcohol dehydrogenase family)|nr:SDR family oxidoreductase [Vicinamibacterales bacterium]